MDTVSVAELKARLSHYLREVRAGNWFMVTSRDIPVATLGPWEPDEIDDLEFLEATSSPGDWGQTHLAPLRRSIDVDALLREVRGGDEAEA